MDVTWSLRWGILISVKRRDELSAKFFRHYQVFTTFYLLRGICNILIACFVGARHLVDPNSFEKINVATKFAHFPRINILLL